MKIKQGNGTTQYGPGIEITLTGDEVARAIDAYLVAKGVTVRGSRTITVNGELCDSGRIYVDPSGFVIDRLGNKIDGRDQADTRARAQGAQRWRTGGNRRKGGGAVMGKTYSYVLVRTNPHDYETDDILAVTIELHEEFAPEREALGLKDMAELLVKCSIEWQLSSDYYECWNDLSEDREHYMYYEDKYGNEGHYRIYRVRNY